MKSRSPVTPSNEIRIKVGLNGDQGYLRCFWSDPIHSIASSTLHGNMEYREKFTQLHHELRENSEVILNKYIYSEFEPLLHHTMIFQVAGVANFNLR